MLKLDIASEKLNVAVDITNMYLSKALIISRKDSIEKNRAIIVFLKEDSDQED